MNRQKQSLISIEDKNYKLYRKQKQKEELQQQQKKNSKYNTKKHHSVCTMNPEDELTENKVVVNDFFFSVNIANDLPVPSPPKIAYENDKTKLEIADDLPTKTSPKIKDEKNLKKNLQNCEQKGTHHTEQKDDDSDLKRHASHNQKRDEENLHNLKVLRKKFKRLQEDATTKTRHENLSLEKTLSKIQSNIDIVDEIRKENSHLREEILYLRRDNKQFMKCNDQLEEIFINYKDMLHKKLEHEKMILNVIKGKENLTSIKEKIEVVEKKIALQNRKCDKETKIKQIYTETSCKIIDLFYEKCSDKHLSKEMTRLLKSRFIENEEKRIKYMTVHMKKKH